MYTNSIDTDQIQIKVGSEEQSDALVKQIKDVFRSKVRVAQDIIFESIESSQKQQMPPMSRKVIKFVDKRN